MSKWAMYVDDSASHGAILNKKFQPFPTKDHGLCPVSTAGGILVKRTAEARIIREINNLRRRIQKSLRLKDLPALHMCEMWGFKRPPDSIYHKATQKQCFRWVRAAYDIIFKYGELGLLKTCGSAFEVPQAQEVYMQHFLSEEALIEDKIIKYAFPEAVKTYYSIIMNPLWRSIMNMIASGNYFCHANSSTLDIFYDTSESSKGLANSEGMQIIRETGVFSSIKNIEEATPSTSPLMQLADVAQYNFFRKKLMEYRVKYNRPHSKDDGMDLARRFRNTSAFATPGPSWQLESIHENQFAVIHTGFATQQMRIKYPEICDAYLISLSQYDISLAPIGGTTGFCPIIRQEVVDAWINGKRPPL